MAKHLPRRDAGDRGGQAKAKNVPLIMRNLPGSFPPFFGRQKASLCSQGELVEKVLMALSQNTLKKIKILSTTHLLPLKDVNAMLNFVNDSKRQTSKR